MEGAMVMEQVMTVLEEVAGNFVVTLIRVA